MPKLPPLPTPWVQIEAIHEKGWQKDTPPITAYHYRLYRQGVFVESETPCYTLSIPVADRVANDRRAELRGLAFNRNELVYWKVPRPSADLLWQIVGDAEETPKIEKLYWVTFEAGTWAWHCPEQRGTPHYVTTHIPRPDNLVIEIHTHGEGRAYWSAVDDEDELGIGLYGVIGGLGPDKSLSMQFRAGVYGHTSSTTILDCIWEKKR